MVISYWYTSVDYGSLVPYMDTKTSYKASSFFSKLATLNLKN